MREIYTSLLKRKTKENAILCHTRNMNLGQSKPSKLEDINQSINLIFFFYLPLTCNKGTIKLHVQVRA